MHLSSDLFIEMSSKIVGIGISKILKFAGGKGGGMSPDPLVWKIGSRRFLFVPTPS